MRQLLWPACTVAVAAAAFVAGGAHERHGLDEVRAELGQLNERVAARSQLPFGGGAANCVAAIDDATLRAELERALRTLQPGATRSAVAEPQRDERPTPSPAAQQADDRARQLVASALSIRSWGEADKSELQRLLGEITPEARDEVLRQLVPAINDGRIALQTHGAPF